MHGAVCEQEKTVGVLGGMGPDATLDLMARVIAATPAADDADHIHIIVDNNPKVPSRIKALIEGRGPTPAPELALMARRLVAAGADFLAMPCNSAHYYYADIVKAVDVPVINLIDLVVERVLMALPGITSLGLLASTAVHLSGLYRRPFEAHGVGVSRPEASGQESVMALIKGVKSHEISRRHIERYNAEAAKLRGRKAQCLVIACTELSVVAERLDTDLPVFDASQLLAEEIVRQVKGR